MKKIVLASLPLLFLGYATNGWGEEYNFQADDIPDATLQVQPHLLDTPSDTTLQFQPRFLQILAANWQPAQEIDSPSQVQNFAVAGGTYGEGVVVFESIGDVYASVFTDGAWTNPQQLSDPAKPSSDPTVACREINQKTTCVAAWVSMQCGTSGQLIVPGQSCNENEIYYSLGVRGYKEGQWGPLIDYRPVYDIHPANPDAAIDGHGKAFVVFEEQTRCAIWSYGFDVMTNSQDDNRSAQIDSGITLNCPNHPKIAVSPELGWAYVVFRKGILKPGGGHWVDRAAYNAWHPEENWGSNTARGFEPCKAYYVPNDTYISGGYACDGVKDIAVAVDDAGDAHAAFIARGWEWDDPNNRFLHPHDAVIYKIRNRYGNEYSYGNGLVVVHNEPGAYSGVSLAIDEREGRAYLTFGHNGAIYTTYVENPTSDGTEFDDFSTPVRVDDQSGFGLYPQLGMGLLQRLYAWFRGNEMCGRAPDSSNNPNVVSLGSVTALDGEPELAIGTGNTAFIGWIDGGKLMVARYGN